MTRFLPETETFKDESLLEPDIDLGLQRVFEDESDFLSLVVIVNRLFNLSIRLSFLTCLKLNVCRESVFKVEIG